MDGNTKQLRSIMRQHRLTAADVAKMLGRQPNTVRVWRCENTQRPIPDDALRLLSVLVTGNAAKARRGAAR